MLNYRKFSFTDADYLILCTIETYGRTASGKCWKSKPDEVERIVYNAEQYTNYVTSIPFFNNFGYGAYCRASHSYESVGYLPTVITSVSPFQTTKKVAKFEFVYIPHLLKSAGYREQEILKNAKRFDLKFESDTKMLYLYTDYTNDIASGIYDTKRKIWKG